MKNHESRLTGLTLFPELNAMRYENNYGRGRGKGCGHDHGQRQINFCNYNVYNSNKPSHNKEKQEKGKLYIVEMPQRYKISNIGVE
jgi:hypothetical protein